MATTDAVAIDMKELKAFVASIRDVSPRVYRVLRQDLLEAGDVITARAKEKAAQHSRTIAPTIGNRLLAVSQTRGVGVRVFAGNADTPIAGLYEAGNKKGRGGSATTFRHPLFGDWAYPQDQPRYPYMKPAAMEMEEVVAERVSFAVTTAADTVMRAGA